MTATYTQEKLGVSSPTNKFLSRGMLKILPRMATSYRAELIPRTSTR